MIAGAAAEACVDEAKLIDKLRKIEALFAGATTDGEQAAADHARRRILERIEQMQRTAPPEEFRCSFPDIWRRTLFIALLRRYELHPFRYPRQRHTTVVVRVNRTFLDETLWPEYLQLSATLAEYMQDITRRVIHEALHDDASDLAVADEPRGLTG